MIWNTFSVLANNVSCYLFSAPYKIGFAQNGNFGLSSAIFAKIPADSIFLLANRTRISMKSCEILAHNMKNGSKTTSLNPKIGVAENR
jgi:hypothetical protein